MFAAYGKVINSLFKGVRLCLQDKKIRRLSIFPWVIGSATYLICMTGVYFYYGSLLKMLVSDSDGWLATIWFYLVATFLLIGLSLTAFMVCAICIMIFGGYFQAEIAAHILRREGVVLQEELSGVKGIASEVSRSIKTETFKLFWLVPLFLTLFIAGFIAPLAPIAFLLASWLLGYQFVDVVLDVMHKSARERFFFAVRHAGRITLFGALLTIASLMPFFGIFLPPIAVTASAIFLSDDFKR